MNRENVSHSAVETRQHNHAIVIGAGVAGLLAARVLADRFARVTVVERDELPVGSQSRRGVPQGRHQHALLLRGRAILEHLFPGLGQELVAAGAPLVSMSEDFLWLTSAGWGVRFESPFVLLACSRDLLEAGIRRRVAANEHVHFVTGVDACGLAASADRTRVTGLRLRRRGAQQSEREEVVDADLVVDAGGRGSRAAAWLRELGYAPPDETVLDSHLGYASRIYRAPVDVRSGWKAAYIQQAPPASCRGGVVFPLEGDRWLVTLSGGGRDYPPTDDQGFLEFARGMRHPLLYDAIRHAEPLSPIVGTRATKNRLRHFERLTRRPERFVALGDAVCAFNPVYAQGMTIAALGALTLAESLDRRSAASAELDGLAKHFYQRLARVNRGPWMLATSQDLRYRDAEGGRADVRTRMMHWYMDRVIHLTTERADVRRRLLAVFNMLAPPRALFHPAVAARVLWLGITRSDTRNVTGRDVTCKPERVI